MPSAASTKQTAPRSLADYTSADLIQPRLNGRTVCAVMEELVGGLRPETCLPTEREAASKALNLELLTGRVDSRAVKAAVQLPGETQPRFVLGRALELLPWRAGGLTPIEFVILLVEPPPGGAEGKQVSAALTRLSQDSERLDALRAARSAGDMLAVLAHVPIRADEPESAVEPSGSHPEAKQMIPLGTLGRNFSRHRRWGGTQSVVSQP